MITFSNDARQSKSTKSNKNSIALFKLCGVASLAIVILPVYMIMLMPLYTIMIGCHLGINAIDPLARLLAWAADKASEISNKWKE